jgi:hypothetical protein
MWGKGGRKGGMPAIVAVCLCGLWAGAAAYAALETIEDAYEIELARLELPAHPLGRVSFSPCAGCDRIGFQVDGNTRYLLAGAPAPVSLGSFREEAARTIDLGDAVVYLIYDTRTRVVTRLVLDGRSR